MDGSVLTCTSCGEREIELYTCETCDQIGECSNDVTKELFCESCICPHVKKGHDVRTSKGQVPLVCVDHKKLHNQYCKTCDVSFCPKCLGNHSEHKMGSIDERAIEIKKEVFEMLTKLELDEKPLRAKKEAISEARSCHENEQMHLQDLCEKKLDELRQIWLKRIDENLRFVELEQKEITDQIEDLLKLQRRSRDSLAMTSPHLVNDFKGLSSEYKEVCEYREKTLAMVCQVKSCDFSDVTELIDQIGNEVDRKLKTVVTKIDNRCLKRFPVMAVVYSNFIFTVEDRIMKIERLKVDGSSSLHLTDVGKIEFSQDVKTYYSIYCTNYLCSCIIFTNSGTIFRADISNSKVCLKTEIEVPAFPNLVCPFGYNGEVHWCYWLEDRKVLKFSHNLNFVIRSTSTPRMRSRGIGGYRIVLTTENNEILIVDPYNFTNELIPRTKHNAKAIDHVTFVGDCLFIWDVEMKSVTFMLKRSKQWSTKETQRWNDPTQLILFENSQISDIRFLPALKCTSGDELCDYVFMTLCLDQ
ncbi:uncharacterized protein LOC142352201 [Convolutriloba macropyga]|uniref:uncharacterized protein LOC142352201 n=1 Tax=Convolutriloba macropyga TaxID=536237 RepID=UPI003F51E121